MDSIRKKNTALGVAIFVAFIMVQVIIAYRLGVVKENINTSEARMEQLVVFKDLENTILKTRINPTTEYINEMQTVAQPLNDASIDKQIIAVMTAFNEQRGLEIPLQALYATVAAKSEARALTAQGSNQVEHLDISKENIIIFIAVLIINVIINVVLWLFGRQITENIEALRRGLSSFFDHLSHKTDSISPVRVSTKDEFFQIANMINENIEQVEKRLSQDVKTVKEIALITDWMEEGDFSHIVKEDPANPQIKDLKGNINKFLMSIQETFGTILNVVSKYQSNNFDERVNLPVKGEMKTLIDGVNALGDALEQSSTKIIASLTAKGQHLQDTSVELNESVTTLANFLQESSKNTAMVTKQVSDISETIKNTVGKVNSMSEVAQRTTSTAKAGGLLADNTLTAMEEINVSTQSIDEAISVIDSIAFQTNILSLNAAVEAATAGEAGKGFAVVAQEVRSLASKSAEAAKKIKDLVLQTQKKAREGMDISQSMKNNFTSVNEQIEETFQLVNSVTADSNEDLLRIKKIEEIILQLQQMSNSNSETMRNTSKVTADLNEIADALYKEVQINSTQS
jgi:methyl-accepting chemotaxis protein